MRSDTSGFPKVAVEGQLVLQSTRKFCWMPLRESCFPVESSGEIVLPFALGVEHGEEGAGETVDEAAEDVVLEVVLLLLLLLPVLLDGGFVHAVGCKLVVSL